MTHPANIHPNKQQKNMKRDDLIALCHYYKGEDEDKCPFTDNRIKEQLWAAEMMACTHLWGMIGDEHPEDDLHMSTQKMTCTIWFLPMCQNGTLTSSGKHSTNTSK